MQAECGFLSALRLPYQSEVRGLHLTPAQVKYLLAVYALEDLSVLKLTRIAERLQVSKPSAHRMLGQLRALGLLTQEKDTGFRLTESGHLLAKTTRRPLPSSGVVLYRCLADAKQRGGENASLLLGSERVCAGIVPLHPKLSTANPSKGGVRRKQNAW